jgi:glucokinase
MKRKPADRRTVLAGDIGGTNTRLGLFRVSGGKVRPLVQQTYPSRDHSSLESILKIFLDGRRNVSAACFGIAGPVIGGVAAATNLPWKVSLRSLQRELGIGPVDLINDMMANACGIGVLQGQDFAVLNAGRKKTGNAAVLAAGTGLGLAVLFWDGTRHLPSPSEGGHAEFGPRTRTEIDLLRYLFDEYGHVSYERVLSGPGLLNIYRFLRDSRQYGKEPEWLKARMQREDPAAVIAGTAKTGRSRLCSKALDLFASIYGAVAGNLALQVMAGSGVYLGGGIAPRIVWKLKDGTFMKAFRSKGRLSGIVERIPVRVIMNDRAALFGAAVRAAELPER